MFDAEAGLECPVVCATKLCRCWKTNVTWACLGLRLRGLKIFFNTQKVRLKKNIFVW